MDPIAVVDRPLEVPAYASLAEPARLRVLDATRLLDTPPSPVLADVARRAAAALGTPCALISLVDGTRQYFAGAAGIGEPWATCRQVPLTHSFCRHVVTGRAPLVVRDAREHPVLRDNGAVIDLAAVAYLGVPLVTTCGQVLGSCCVCDVVPRDWSAHDLATLATFADEAMREIERLLLVVG